MVRKLKFHEQKLLKKTDFYDWEIDNHRRDALVLRKFHITKRAHYTLYNTLAAEARALAELIAALPAHDPFRESTTKKFLSKFYAAGLIPSADSLERLAKVSASSFARRRLPVVMKHAGMVQRVADASDLVEQGHVQVATRLVTDPAFLVARAQEDLITWTRESAIRRKVSEYNNQLDDFELGAQ